MLPAPSPLSRICGHSHFKKFWLMQTQKEAQANILAEKNASLAKPTSCCMPSAPVRISDGKSSSRWFPGSPSMRTVLRGLSSTKNLSSPSGACKHASLVTCAESLSSPELVNISLHEKPASLNRKDKNNNTDPGLQCYLGEGNEDTHRMDLPVAARSTSVTSSSWESPSRQTYYDISCDDLVRKTDLSATMDIDGDELMNNPHEQMRSGEWDFSKSQQLRNTSMEDYFCGNLKEPGRNIESLRSQVRGCRSHGRVMMQTCLDERQGRNLEVDDVDEDHDVEGGAALFEDEKLQDLNKFETNIGLSNLRACSHCGTTKTPLWRSGPQGPKTLCNACGIRFKKSRRYTGFVGESLTSPATPNSRSFSRSLKRKQESSVESHPVHYHGEDADMVSVNLHKRSRWPTRLSLKSGCSRHQKEDHTGSTAESCLTWNLHSPSSVSFSPRSGYRQYVKDSKQICEQINLARMFARDEDEEAAVLLMALSCGFVNA